MEIITLRNNPDDHPPDETVGDKADAVVNAVASLFPAGSEFFSLVLAPPIEKRRDEWLDSLATRLRDLEEKVHGFKVEMLVENEAFVSATLQATHVAVRTHQKAKLDALRNAVVNVATTKSHERLQEFFLLCVDEFTGLHLNVLDFIAKQRRGHQEEFPFLNDSALANQAAADLEHRGLIERNRAFDGGARAFGSPPDYFWRSYDGDVGSDSRPTELGTRFLEFITDPA